MALLKTCSFTHSCWSSLSFIHLYRLSALPHLYDICLTPHSKSGKPAHFKAQFHKKQVILGLLALMGNVPDASLPPELANGLPQLLSGVVRLLLDLKEQQDEAAKERGSDDDDEGPVRMRQLFACLFV